MPPNRPATTTPLIAGVACYVGWGLVPLLFQLLGHLGVSSWEILAHRAVWSVPVAALFVLLAKQWSQALAVFRNPRTLAWLALSAMLIAINWSIFIWAVNSGRVLETSLGYYINPLLSMAAGALIFRERIDRIGLIAIALATLGVVIQTVALGRLPIVSLTLALAFCGYGIVRKRVKADAQTGLLIECLLLGGPGLAYVLWTEAHGLGHAVANPVALAWLIACGPATAVPLVLFAWAARRISLSVMGFLQFIAPTMSFALGIAQGEAFSSVRAASFAMIWGGAAVFAYGAWRGSRPELKATAFSEPA